jgi:AraC-like DNA-binding protein/Tfp pilus assembly protein PilF
LLDKITPDDYIEYHYVLYFIGSDYLRFGDVQRAIPYLHRALHPKPSYFADRSDLRARLSLANYYAGINQLDSADYYYRSLYDDTTTVRFRPSFDVHAAVGITNNMLKREQFAEALPLALRWLQPAQRDRMESAILNLYINIGECYLADNKHAMALAMCDSVQMLVDKNPKLRNSRYYNFMFDCYLKTGDNTKAQQYADSMQRAATNNAKQTGSLVILRAEQELFETEKALHEQQISGYRTRIFIVTLILALIVAASIVILLLYRQKWAAYRALVAHIKQLQSEQDVKTRTLLQKTTFRNAQTSNSSFCPDSRQDKLYLKIRDLLLKDKIHRDPYLSRDLLVKRLGINRYNLEDAFLFCFGMQYAEYINLLRINDAITLLEQSDLSIEEIAEKAGFGSVRTFQRQFQIKYNISPKDYRKMTKKEEKTA